MTTIRTPVASPGPETGRYVSARLLADQPVLAAVLVSRDWPEHVVEVATRGYGYGPAGVVVHHPTSVTTARERTARAIMEGTQS